MIKVRQMAKSDAHLLIDIDRKGQEFPFTMEDWEVALNAVLELDPKELWRIDVATMRETPRGYVFSIIDPERLFLIRLVVTPSCRKQGLGTALLDRAIWLAREYGKPKIELIVPEIDCRGEPGDMGSWLLSKGFKCVDTRKELFSLYGMQWDGMCFRLEL